MVDTTAHWDFENLAKVLKARQQPYSPPEATVVRVAEWNGLDIPNPIAFRAIVPQELSTTDVVFVDQVIPRTQKMILAIDAAEQLATTFLIIEVGQVKEFKSQRGRQFVVNCRLLKRLHLSDKKQVTR